MGIELPADYEPPEPTHPTYGYRTPEEQEAERLGQEEGPVAGGAEEQVAVEPSERTGGWVPSEADFE